MGPPCLSAFDADLGTSQRRGVVEPVSGYGDESTFIQKAFDHGNLLVREYVGDLAAKGDDLDDAIDCVAGTSSEEVYFVTRRSNGASLCVSSS